MSEDLTPFNISDLVFEEGPADSHKKLAKYLRDNGVSLLVRVSDGEYVEMDTLPRNAELVQVQLTYNDKVTVFHRGSSDATDVALVLCDINCKLYEQDKDRKSQLKAEQKYRNIAILKKACIPFTHRNGGDVILIRNKNKSTVSFYPTTNRWHYTENGVRKLVNGGARKLVKWLNSQKK